MEMLNIDMDIEADLGIDSIKRVEILSTLEERLPGLTEVAPDQMAQFKTLRQMITHLTGTAETPPTDLQPTPAPLTEPETRSAVSTPLSDNLQETLLEIVSELTGYPVEMLNLDQQLEADLGIDSIKRVEILSALEEKLPTLPAIDPETAGTLKTLGQIIAHIGPSTEKAATEPVMEAKEDVPSQDDVVEATIETASKLPRYDLELATRQLSGGAAVNWPSQQEVVIVDDGSPLSGSVLAALKNARIPATLVSTDIQAIREKIKTIGGLILIAPEDISSETLRDFLMLTKELGRSSATGRRKQSGYFCHGIPPGWRFWAALPRKHQPLARRHGGHE